MSQTPDVNTLLDKMAADLRAEMSVRQIENPLMVGIYSGGVWIAERLHKMLDIKDPLGTLNISFYRDDFTRIGVHPQVKPSNLPVSVENRDIVLIDDVLFTGRTIRAALNEIFDYGRPHQVMLAVLVDRGGRELPIQADVVGEKMQLSAREHVKLTGPTPLSLAISTES